MKKVHVESFWGFPDEAGCGIPWHPKKRIKTTLDHNKVTCLKCRKILGLDIKESDELARDSVE